MGLGVEQIEHYPCRAGPNVCRYVIGRAVLYPRQLVLIPVVDCRLLFGKYGVKGTRWGIHKHRVTRMRGANGLLG